MIKKFLSTILLMTTLCLGDSLVTQQHRAERTMWFEQKQFGLDKIYMTIHVRSAKAMHEKNCWGSMHLTPDGPDIEVMAMEDYTAGMSRAERRRHQKEVVAHEILHVLMIRTGVPNSAQDSIIEAVRPGVRIP